MNNADDPNLVFPLKNPPILSQRHVVEQDWWMSLVEFAVHILTGTVIFLGIAAPAVGIDLLLQWLSTLHVSSFILGGLALAKKALFGADLCLFLIYVVNTSWRFVRSLKWAN
jgi:hypothetical protein